MKNQKGITLIALIITIIVMLILVGVSVSISLNGGLFKTAKQAVEGTKIAEEKEQLLAIALGKINDEGKVVIADVDKAIEGTELFTGEGGVYTSTKTGKTYKVTDRGSVKNSIVILPADYEEGDEVPDPDDYEVGNEVKIGNEHFYVIENSTDKVKLLSKYNLKADGTQATTADGNSCVFSAAGNFTAGEDLNNQEALQADTTSAVYKAMKYGEKFEVVGVTGRLMTLGELEALGGDPDSPFLDNCPSFVQHQSFWLGTAFGSSSVWSVATNQTLEDPLYPIDGEEFNYGWEYGVRPVLEVSKSAI